MSSRFHGHRARTVIAVLEPRMVLLDHVLINPEPVVKRPPRRRNPARAALEHGLGEALSIDALDLQYDSELVPFCQEDPVVDEPADREQAVQSAGVFVRFEKLADVKLTRELILEWTLGPSKIKVLSSPLSQLWHQLLGPALIPYKTEKREHEFARAHQELRVYIRAWRQIWDKGIPLDQPSS